MKVDYYTCTCSSWMNLNR